MSEYIRQEAIKRKWVMPENKFLYMDEIIYMNKKGRDADNTKKLLQDSITESGVVWTDDTYCLPRTQRILIDANRPRVEIQISEVDYIGVFNSVKDLVKFRNEYCSICRYYKKGRCQILCRAIEGRIQDEILCNKEQYVCKAQKIKKGSKV